jgi:hypothetical protein
MFLHNCRKPPANRQLATLTTDELDFELKCTFKLIQQTFYAQELHDLTSQKEVSCASSLRTLHPFIDKEGILRAGGGGRFQQSTLLYQFMHQVILPYSFHFTKPVVSCDHFRLLHAGSQLLIASLRENYRIPRNRNIVKTVIHHNLPCYRYKAKASQQLVSELPSLSVRPARSFLNIGVDYAGPLSIRLSRPASKHISKGYIAIFEYFVI